MERPANSGLFATSSCGGRKIVEKGSWHAVGSSNDMIVQDFNKAGRGYRRAFATETHLQLRFVQ